MSYAANLGRDRIIQMLGELGAEDIVHAMGRALLQGQIETARRLYAMGARPPSEAVMGPAEPKRSRSWKSPEMSGLKLPAPKAGQFPNHTTIHGCPCEGVDIHASGIKGMVTSGG